MQRGTSAPPPELSGQLQFCSVQGLEATESWQRAQSGSLPSHHLSFTDLAKFSLRFKTSLLSQLVYIYTL